MDDRYCPRCTPLGDPRFWRGEKTCPRCAYLDRGEGHAMRSASPPVKMDSKARAARIAAIDEAHYRVAYDNTLESYFRAALLTLRARKQHKPNVLEYSTQRRYDVLDDLRRQIQYRRADLERELEKKT